MATSLEEDPKPVEKEPLLMPVVDLPLALGPSQGFRCRPPPLQHQVPYLGCRCPPAPTNFSSAQLHLQGPQPPSAVSTKKKVPIAGSSGTGAGPRSGRSQMAPSRNGAAATVAKIQRSAPLAGADSSGPNLFEEFRYIPLADRKAKDQVMAACSAKVRCCQEVCGTMATKESMMLQKQEAGSRAAAMSCPVGEFCNGSVVCPIQGKKELSPQMDIPLSCSDYLPIPLDKFMYAPLADQKHQEQCGSAWRLSSLSPEVGAPKVRRQRMQAVSQQSKLQGFAGKRRKAVPVSAAEKPNNKKPVSQQKPKRTSSAVLTAAEKRLDMYHHLPPDKLVAPRRHTPTNFSSTQLHLQGPQAPLAVSTKKKELIAGSSGTGVGPRSGRSQVARSSRNGAAAAITKIQRPAPLASADSRTNLFEEFQYIPLADSKAKDQAMAACSVKVCCCPEVCGTMATEESIMLQQQEAGSRAAAMSCPVGEFCHGCLCVHPVGCPIQGKKELSLQMDIPLSCSDDLPIPLDKFMYTPLAEQKHQEQCGSDSRLSSLSPEVGGPKVGWKRMQAASQHSNLQGFADKRRKVVPVSAARKPNNQKPVSSQKPKRASSAVLTAAEKHLDMYRRLPPDQLVAPRRQTPYNLIQERYAPDPWKVMVICMLLNRTKGKTINQFVEGFFTRYPDAQTACDANLAEMVEYLRPTGFQLEKAVRIQKFSSSYLSSDWTYVTELHGVGKYAADAYAIFCAGRMMDVQPEDHKLVDYWKYVCNIGEPWEEEEFCFTV